MFSHITADDWHAIAREFPEAVAKLQELELLREYEYLCRACRGRLASPWQYDRLGELERLLSRSG